MENRNAFVLTILATFILFLSMLDIIFDMQGKVFALEISALMFMLIVAVYLLQGVVAGKVNSWNMLLIFFCFNLINQILLWGQGVEIGKLILPFLVTLAGFFIVMRRGNPAVEDVQIHYEDSELVVSDSPKEIKVKNKAKKTVKKKSVKKKAAKKVKKNVKKKAKKKTVKKKTTKKR